MRQAEALRVLGDYAADQWGLVTTAQAGQLGVDRVTIARLVDAGLLTHVSRGVYGIPAAMPSGQVAERAAWLRLAPDQPGWQREPLDQDGGVVSHRSAARMHDLGDLVADAVEITVPRRRVTRDPGVRLRTGRLTADEVIRVDGLPVTTVNRMIVDLLADHTDGGHVGDVLAAAHRRHMVDLPALATRVAAYAPAYGIRGTGPDRGARLVTRLLEEAHYDPRDDHERHLSTVASQLAALDSDQLRRLSQWLLEVGPKIDTDWQQVANINRVATDRVGDYSTLLHNLRQLWATSSNDPAERGRLRALQENAAAKLADELRAWSAELDKLGHVPLPDPATSPDASPAAPDRDHPPTPAH